MSEICPQTPESLTTTFQEIWKTRGENVDREFIVPACNWSKAELDILQRQGRGLTYLPPEIFLPGGLVLLGKIFPGMKSHSLLEGASFKNEYDDSGWIAIETSIYAPNADTTESHLRDILTSQGRKGMRLPTYIVASWDSKLFNGQYFDENSCSRLIGTLWENRTVSSLFLPTGRLHVGRRFGPVYRGFRLGGRSEDLKGKV